jgi:hypothetical protein
MIVKGWEKCGLLRAFDKMFQAEAMESHAHNYLFSDTNMDDQHEDLEDIQEWQELFEDADIMELMALCVISD